MIKYFLAVIFFFIFWNCNESKSIVTPSNSTLMVDKLYGLGYSGRVTLRWEIDSSTRANQFGIYRSNLSAFSYEQSERIATIELSDSMKMKKTNSTFVDSNLINGATYFYTIVLEQSSTNGELIRSISPKTIPIKPFDYSALSTDQIKYSQHIQPIFTGGCAIHGCHAGTIHIERSAFKKLVHGGSEFSLRTWSEALNGTDDAAQIVPFRASKSHIIHHLNSDTSISPIASPSMPMGLSFPTALRDVIIRWINGGAKFDDGSTAFSTMPNRGWAYVTNQGEDLTAVVDLDRNRIARYITTGVENTSAAPPHSPHNVVVDWQNQFYYVNLIGASKLLKFRVADNGKVGELTAGLTSPAQVALSKNGDTAYVSNFFDKKNFITVVNTATMTKIGDVGSDAISAPHGVTITPDFRYVIVSNSASDNVSILRTADNVIIKTIPIAWNVPPIPVGYTSKYEPYQSVVTPDNQFAFVTCRKSGEVRVIDLQQLKVIDSIIVGSTPLIPAISPDGEWVYVANRNSNSLSIIKTSTRTVDYTITGIGVEPHGVAVSKDGKFVYVSCENLGISDPPHHPTIGGKKISFLKIIDAEKRSVIASIEMGNFGSGIAVTH